MTKIGWLVMHVCGSLPGKIAYMHVHVNMEGRLLRLHLWGLEQKPHVQTVPRGREMVEKSSK